MSAAMGSAPPPTGAPSNRRRASARVGAVGPDGPEGAQQQRPQGGRPFALPGVRVPSQLRGPCREQRPCRRRERGAVLVADHAVAEPEGARHRPPGAGLLVLAQLAGKPEEVAERHVVGEHRRPRVREQVRALQWLEPRQLSGEPAHLRAGVGDPEDAPPSRVHHGGGAGVRGRHLDGRRVQQQAGRLAGRVLQIPQVDGHLPRSADRARPAGAACRRRAVGRGYRRGERPAGGPPAGSSCPSPHPRARRSPLRAPARDRPSPCWRMRGTAGKGARRRGTSRAPGTARASAGRSHPSGRSGRRTSPPPPRASRRGTRWVVSCAVRPRRAPSPAPHRN